MFTLLGLFVPGMSGPIELLIVGGIILLLFGNRLPGAMRSLGRSVVEFKKGIRGDGSEDDDKVEDKSKPEEAAK